jgi:hypothetical protein
MTPANLRGDSKTCFQDQLSHDRDGSEDSPDHPYRRIARTHASCISKSARGAHDLETSAVLETGADVQIGGGVRVGDAFQAKVESQSSYMGNDRVVSEFLKQGLLDLRTFNKRNSPQLIDIRSGSERRGLVSLCGAEIEYGCRASARTRLILEQTSDGNLT